MATRAQSPKVEANSPDSAIRCSRGDVAKEFVMALHMGDMAPDFTAETTEGWIKFHDWMGDGWAVLFFGFFAVDHSNQRVWLNTGKA